MIVIDEDTAGAFTVKTPLGLEARLEHRRDSKSGLTPMVVISIHDDLDGEAMVVHGGDLQDLIDFHAVVRRWMSGREPRCRD